MRVETTVDGVRAAVPTGNLRNFDIVRLAEHREYGNGVPHAFLLRRRQFRIGSSAENFHFDSHGKTNLAISMKKAREM